MSDTASTAATATDVGSLRLHAHFDEGDGPAIVMLHGINSDGGDWRTVIDTIGPGYRFIAFDLLGFGASPKPLDIDYSADEHALVIANTLDALGVSEPFLLVGYSLGGDIALRFASTWPERVRRLFLLDAPFYLPASELTVGGTGLKYLYEAGSRRLWDLLATSKAKDNFVYRLASGVGAKALEDAFHADDIPTHWEIMSKNLENTVNAATFVDDLPRLTMPVVFAVGVRDAIVKVNQTPALKRLKPDMEIRKITGLAADHMTLWNMPERVAAEIMRDEVRALNVVWRGGSGDPLVLLHGLQNPAAQWVPVAEILARTHDVAVLDLLGFGESPAPLSAHYTAAEHAAAVLGTVSELWGSGRRVLFAGEGLGATVALECAATAPERSAGVVAIAPALLEPGADLDALATDERSARTLALRERATRLAQAERAGLARSEEVEARVAPLLRSAENAMLGTDAADLLAAVPPPVRFVAPADDALTPAAYLERVSAERDGFEFETVPGGRTVAYERPAVVVQAIAPEDREGIALAARAKPVRVARSANPVVRSAGGAESALLRAGLLNVAAALLVLAIHPVDEQVLTFGFAAWLVVSSVSAIVGAIGMRRHTAGTRFTFVTTALPTLLLGLAGLALASIVVADPADGRRFFGAAVAAYAMLRGAADLWLARTTAHTARPRWLLYAGGTIGVVTALAIVFGPNHGRGVLRLSLALYLSLTGVALISYVVAARRAARKRVAQLLGD